VVRRAAERVVRRAAVSAGAKPGRGIGLALGTGQL